MRPLLRSSILGLLFLCSSALSQTLVDLSGAPYKTVTEVKKNFTDLRRYYDSRRDRRALFVNVYRQVTVNIEDLIRTKQVTHGPWLNELILGFANEYREALWLYELPVRSRVPGPWLFDFDNARTGTLGPPTQLLLSMNSHILYDLPRIVAESVPAAGSLAPYREDYFKLNPMFRDMMPDLFRTLYRDGGHPEESINHPVEKIKLRVLYLLVLQMRKFAWDKAVQLHALKDPTAREAFVRGLDQQVQKISQVESTLDPFLSNEPGKAIPWAVKARAIRGLRQIFELLGGTLPSIFDTEVGVNQPIPLVNFDIDLNTHCRRHHGAASFAQRSARESNGWLCAAGNQVWGIDLHGACRELSGNYAVYVGGKANNNWQCVGPSEKDIDLNDHCRQYHGPSAFAKRSARESNGWLCAAGRQVWGIDLHGACRELGMGRAVYVGNRSNNNWRCAR